MITNNNPGITCSANLRLPVVIATTALVIVLVVSPTRIGSTAASALMFPTVTSEATEIAAECVSAKPASPAAITSPEDPSQRFAAADARSIADTVTAKITAVKGLKARPDDSALDGVWLGVLIVNSAP